MNFLAIKAWLGSNLMLIAIAAFALLFALTALFYSLWQGKVKEFAAYQATVEQIGKAAAEEQTRLETKRDAITKQKEAAYGLKYQDLSARYADARKRLRDQNAGSDNVRPLSSAASSSACPDGQAKLAGGLEQLEGEILGLLERGDRAIERTELCRDWLTDQTSVVK